MSQPAEGAKARRRSASPWLTAAAYLVLVIAVVAVSEIAYKAMFSSLDLQDDSGFDMIGLREYLRGGSVYGDVYSPYGPGLFVFLGGLGDVLGIPMTTDGVRLLILGAWLAAILVCGAVLLRLTRNPAIAVAGLLLSFLVLAADVNEPGHPGAAIALLLLAIVAVAAYGFERRPAVAMGAIGATAAVIFTLKPNVGGLALASVALACALAPGALPRRRLRIALTAAVVLLPVVLCWPHLDDPDLLRLCVLVVTGLLGLVAVSSGRWDDEHPDGRDVVLGIGAAAATLMLVVAVPIIGGSTPGELIDGWFLRPLGTTDFFAAIPIPGIAPAWAVLGLALATFVAWRRRSDARTGPRLMVATGIARGLFGLAIWIALTTPIWGAANEVARGLTVAAPFTWVAAVPPRDARREPRFVRVLLVSLAVLQIMHVYPVAGSQVGWAQLLLVVVGGLCIFDGAVEVAGALATEGRRQRVAQAAAATAAVGFAIWFCLSPLAKMSERFGDAYDAGVSLGLPGADRLHLAPDRVEALRATTEVLRANCDTYISIPGLNSFYLWAQLPVPPLLSGAWPYQYGRDDQLTTLDSVRGTSRLCILRNREVLAFWRGFSEPAPALPLLRFVRRPVERVGEFGGYVVDRVPRPGDG